MWRSVASCGAALWLAGCAVAKFDVAGAADEAQFSAAHPYYAEFCALTQIKKRRGFGADIRGEIGGHAVFYLNGACRDPGYPVLRVCEGDGVGLSMNAHFRNAKWTATPGRAFFFDGGLAAGSPVTRAAYAQVQADAKRLGVYDGVTFHDAVFADKPEGWTDEDWRYEVSIATDYAISLGRGRYCARVPATRAQMGTMVAFLNAENAPYQAGTRSFEWSVFTDNCIHLAHNALAAAGLWAPWPVGRPLAVAVFDFPVPKNEFVNLMRRTNDDWLPDPGAVYADIAARRELLAYERLPSMPGGLAEAHGARVPNDVYETELKLIFYSEPIFGTYESGFAAMFAEPRYFEAGANRAYFARLARKAEEERKPLAAWLARTPYRSDPEGFGRVYAAYYALMARLAQ